MLGGKWHVFEFHQVLNEIDFIKFSQSYNIAITLFISENNNSKGGKSLDTSMGFSPLEGLIMGGRSGDIDANVINYISKQLDHGRGF